MVRASNCFVGLFNCCSLALGVVAISLSVYFQVHGGTDCQNSLHTPLLITGIVLSVVSLLGLIGSCCRVNFLLYSYLFVMFLLIVGFAIFTAFVFVVTNNGAGKAVSGLGFKEFHLGNYSSWLQKHFVNEKNWNGIRSCLIDAHVCKSLGRNTAQMSAADFYKKNVSPIQSGCCKPPNECGFEYQNATFWTVPASGPAIEDRDCILWSNQQETLCYDCNSCKAGVLANIKREWRLLAIVNVCVIVFFIIIYSAGCCAKRNNRADGKYRYGGYRSYP